MKVEYSDGEVIEAAVIQIWEDWHASRPGFHRAFWCASPTADCGSPVVGYGSPGGSYRTIREVVAECYRLYPDEPVYRNGVRLR